MRRVKRKTRRLDMDVIKRAAQMMCVLCCFLVIGYGGFWLSDPEHFPIVSVNLIGDRKQVALDDMKGFILPQAESGFFRFNVAELQHGLLTLPWLQSVSVRKAWPDKVLIQYEENVPVVRWGVDGLISEQGHLFFPTEGNRAFSDLPLLMGPAEKAEQVWDMYLKIEQLLRSQSLSVSEITLSPRGAWTLRLSNGIQIVLGTDRVLEKLENFLLCYKVNLKERHHQLATVDLRYTNGMALGWKHH